MSIEFRVSRDARCVQGHFPGAPVVPGAFLLAKLHGLLSEHYPDWTLNEWKKVKFLAPARPEQALALEWDEARWPKLKVTLNGPAGAVLQGQLTLSPAGSHPDSESQGAL